MGSKYITPSHTVKYKSDIRSQYQTDITPVKSSGLNINQPLRKSSINKTTFDEKSAQSTNLTTNPSTQNKKLNIKNRGKQASIDLCSSEKKQFGSGHKVNQSFDLSSIKHMESREGPFYYHSKTQIEKPKNPSISKASHKSSQIREGSLSNQTQEDKKLALKYQSQKSQMQQQIFDTSPGGFETNYTSNTHKYNEDQTPQGFPGNNAYDESPFRTKSSFLTMKDSDGSPLRVQFKDQLENEGNKEDKNELQLQTIQDITRRIELTHKDLEVQLKQVLDLKLKYNQRDKLITNLQNNYKSQASKNPTYSELIEIKAKNDILRENFRNILKEKEQIKLRMRTIKSEAINVNLEIDDQLRHTQEKIRELERVYYRVQEELAFYDKSILRKEQILSSINDQVTVLSSQRDEFKLSKIQYQNKIERIKDQLINQRQDFESFKRTETNFNDYKRKSIAAILLKIGLQKLVSNNQKQQITVGFDGMQKLNIKIKASIALGRIYSRSIMNKQKQALIKSFSIWAQSIYFHKSKDINFLNKFSNSKVQSTQLKFFIQWREAYNQRRTMKTHSRLKLNNLIQVLNKRIFQKNTANAFQIWKSLIHQRYFNLIKLRHVIKNKRRLDIQFAFDRWSNKYTKQSDKINCFEILRRRSVKQLKIRAFYGLREAVKQQKLDKYQLKLNFFKEWRYRYLQNLYVKNMQGFGLKVSTLGQKELLMQKVLNAFKLNYIKNKNERIQTQFKSKHIQVIEDCNNSITKSNSENQARALILLKKTLLRWRGCKIRPTFEYWKSLITNYNRTNQVSLYRKLKNYKLLQAFGQWKYKAQQARNNQQFDIIQSYQHQAKQDVEIIMKIKAQSEQLSDQSSSKGKAKCIRALIHQQQIVVKEAFQKWRLKMLESRKQNNRLRVVFAKVFTRQLRMSFQKYAKQAKKATRYINHEVLLDKYRPLQQIRLMRFFYQVIAYNTQQSLLQKQYLQRLSHKKQNKTLKFTFKRFAQVLKYKQLKHVNQVEMNQIENYNVIMHEVVEKQSHLQQQKNYLDKCEKKIDRIGAQTLKKYLNKIRCYQQMKAFSTWKEETIVLRNQQRQISHILRIIGRKDKSEAFQYWKLLMHEKRISLTKNRTLYIQKSIHKNSIEHLRNTDENQQTKEQLIKKLELQQNFVNKYQHTYTSLINIFHKNSNNKVQQKLHHYVIREWRARNLDVKKKFGKVEKLMKKIGYNSGFEQIKAIYGEQNQLINNKTQLQNQKLQQVQKTMLRGFLRSAFSQWRNQQYTLAFNNIKDTQKDIQTVQIKVSKQNQSYKQAICSLIRTSQQDKSLFDFFHSWKSVISSQKSLRLKTDEFYHSQRHLQISQTLQKWNKRAKLTHLCKHKIRNISIKNDMMIKRLYFSALNSQMQKQKELRRELTNCFKSIIQKRVKMVFENIKYYSNETITQKECTKNIKIKQIVSTLQIIRERRMHKYFSEIKSTLRHEKLQHLMLKSILRFSSKQIYAAINQWKSIVFINRIAQECKQEGSIAIEVLNSRLQFEALKKMIIDKEQIAPSQFDQYIHEENQRKNQLLNKAIIRMKLYNEQGFIKPKYFDILKQNYIQNKQRKQALKQVLLNLTNSQSKAFSKWKSLNKNLQSQLSTFKCEKLKSISLTKQSQRIQSERLLDVKDTLQYHKDNQIEILEQNHSRAKKIFVRLIAKRDQLILGQYMSKWQSKVHEHKKISMKQRLQQQQKTMELLKDQIRVVERANLEISQQNKNFQNQAITGMLSADKLELLSADRTRMSMELAEKTLLIRRLLEENKNLNIRLSQSRLYGELQKSQSQFSFRK
eukprot:403376981